MQTSHTRRSIWNYAGIAILLAGMALGEFVYWRGSGISGGDEAAQGIRDTKTYDLAVRQNVGAFGSIINHIEEAFASLGEPGPLAITICAASAAAAGGCFFAASRIPREDEPANGKQNKNIV